MHGKHLIKLMQIVWPELDIELNSQVTFHTLLNQTYSHSLEDGKLFYEQCSVCVRNH